MRDIEEYYIKYEEHNFEKYNVLYRRKRVLGFIEKYRPKKILEIGCGIEPLFLFVPEAEFTVVEPSSEFCNNAINLSEGNSKIECLQGFFEEVVEYLSCDYDMVVCASLLHEVENPEELLHAIASICKKDTIVHIDVPNANSMHRILGKEVGIISDVHDKSESNIVLQQNNVFDMQMLKSIVEKNFFRVVESGSYFIKPFTHAQMFEMLQAEIIDEAVIEGLYRLGDYFPEFGSEIYVNCILRQPD